MFNKTRQSGVTLPEMLTAVAITVIMLSASGMIFRSASKSSGKAMALNSMMAQSRVITNQLDKDFAGFRGDLPFGIIFEAYNRGNNTFSRRDRVFFFSNGDWQDLEYSYRSDTARIFYGQSTDVYSNIATDEFTEIPQQRFLARKLKLMTSVNTYVPGMPYDQASDGNIDWFDYEMAGMEYGPDSIWKNASASFFDIYLLENKLSPSYEYLNNDGESFIRRPCIGSPSSTWGATRYVQAANSTKINISYSRVDDYKQGIYMIDDLTDFSVQAWLTPPGENQPRWFPDDSDIANFLGMNPVLNAPLSGTNYNLPGGDAYFGIGANLNSTQGTLVSFPLSGAIPALNYGNIGNIGGLNIISVNNNYPKALKFSYKLYDSTRNHFPEGKYFEYIVKLTK